MVGYFHGNVASIAATMEAYLLKYLDQNITRERKRIPGMNVILRYLVMQGILRLLTSHQTEVDTLRENVKTE